MPSSDVTVAQKVARYALIGALVVLGAWMLQHFLPALCWAVVLAIGTSKLYDKWLPRFRGRHRDLWAALTFTTLVGVILIGPLAYGGIAAVREALSLLHHLRDSQAPPELPPWLLQLPMVGDWIKGVWTQFMTQLGAHALGDQTPPDRVDLASQTFEVRPAMAAVTFESAMAENAR